METNLQNREILEQNHNDDALLLAVTDFVDQAQFFGEQSMLLSEIPINETDIEAELAWLETSLGVHRTTELERSMYGAFAQREAPMVVRQFSEGGFAFKVIRSVASSQQPPHTTTVCYSIQSVLESSNNNG